MGERCAIGVDLGGTGIKAAIVSEAHILSNRRSLDTEAARGPDHVIARIATIIEELARRAEADGAEIVAVGVGSPGPLSYARGVVLHAPNLPGWRDVPLRDRLRAATGRRVFIENDANAAAYGEFVSGAGKAASDMVMLTLGTGVGGGVILEGRLLRGHYDNAGEIGHMIVEPEGDPCPCGQRGCLERYASASAVGRWAQRALEAGEQTSLRGALERSGGVNARDVELAMAAGDAVATRIWRETARYLAIAAVNVQHVLNPEQIVFAGGLIGAGERLLAPVREAFAELTWNSAKDGPTFALATLGTDAGIIGVAALAREAAEHAASG